MSSESYYIYNDQADLVYHQYQGDAPRTPKRTPMACTFCRGRKLKCDGLKPSCGNCNRRGFACVYTPVSHDQQQQEQGR